MTVSPNYIPQYQGNDDQVVTVSRNDFSGGNNTRQQAQVITEKQVEQVENWDMSIPGQLTKLPGSSLIADDVGSASPAALYNFEVQGYTAQLVMAETTNLWKWTGTGNWASLKTGLTTSTDYGMVMVKESGESPDDVLIVQNGLDSPRRYLNAGTEEDLLTGATSPPKSTVMGWYGNRLWILKDDLLYYSDAYPATYSTAFAANHVFRIPVGEERKLLCTRDSGMVVMGKKEIWSLAPSAVPDPTTDYPQFMVPYGVVSKNAALIAGDDIYFFSFDGFRSLKRTINDKLQVTASFPISYKLKDQHDRISWGNISKLSMIYWDNKILIAVPTGASTFDTWVYYPALDSFMVISGLAPTCWATYKVSGSEQLFYGTYGNTTVNRLWTGYVFAEGTITSTLIGRQENMGYPLQFKNGGELIVEAACAGADDILTVYVSIDGRDFNTLGTVDLRSTTSPALPVELPFTLADTYNVRKTFHLDSIGRWRALQVKVTTTGTATDDIIFYNYSIVTYVEEYQNE